VKGVNIALLFAFAAAILAGASRSAAQPPRSDQILLPADTSLVITMERIGCFGMCPDYTVSIGRDGAVSYVGRHYVKVKGLQQSRIAPDTLRQLIRDFRDAGFFKLADRYDGGGTDGPTVITTFMADSLTKTVVDYYEAPENLHRLEARIDEVTNTEQWIQAAARRHLIDSLRAARESTQGRKP
jgi:hypothetical protein